MTTSLRLGAIDLHRPAIDVLVDKINAINTLSLVAADFTLGLPVAEAGSDYDTKILLNPSVSSVWLNAKWAYYTRVTLESLLRIPTRVVTAGNPLLYDILDAVNTAYGIYLQEADVEQASIQYVSPQDPNGPGTVKITARQTSVFYKGEFTIPVNTQARQGLNTYDDEAIYYVHVAKEGADTLHAYNIRGEHVDTFTPFKGATFTVCEISHFEMLKNGDLMVIGDFAYSTVNGFGETVYFTRKLLKLNPVGEIIDSAAGNSFGANYPDIKRVFDTDTGAAYAIDPTNAIGGRLSLIHRFNSDGSYDNLFNLGLTGPANNFAIDATHIYVAAVNAGVVTVTKHNKTTGAIDATFGPLVVSTGTTTNLQIHTLAVDAEGIKLAVDLVEATRKASEPLLFNGTAMWTPGPETAQWFPCLNFTLTGLAKPASIYWRAGITPEFTGNIWSNPPVSALSSGWLTFCIGTYHPYYGSESLVLAAVAPDGEIVRSSGLDPKQAPRWQYVHSITHIENGDIAVCGEVMCVNDALELASGTALALYNRLGEISSTLVSDTTTGIVFKKVVGRVP